MTCPDRPKQPSNRPGLPGLSYRIGDYASFRERLINRLTCDLVLPGQPQGISLRQLKTRTQDDPAIALLDAFSVVADVLTFYQERIINEGYLMTATERRSVLELARMIGYELEPGVAASTLLAFTVEEAPDSPKIALVAKGTQIMSIPEQDELPQIFETSDDFTAHVEWNALKPRPARPQKIMPTTRQILLKGTSTGLRPGDTLLLMDGEDARKPYYFLTVDRVELKAANGYTVVAWLPKELKVPPLVPRMIAFRQRVNLFGFNAPRWEAVSDDIKQTAGGKIRGGIFRNSGKLGEVELPWQSVNTGLLSFDIRCLAVSTKGTLLAGTPIGLFRSTNNGETWTLSNAGLTNFNIQTIYATNGNLLLGTTNGGVFSSMDDGETWSPIGIGSVTVEISTSGDPRISTPKNTGIPNTVVRSLTSIAITLSPPTLSTIGDNTTLQITRGSGMIPLDFQREDVIVIDRQARSVTEVFPVNPSDPNAPITLKINDSFRNTNQTERSLVLGTSFIAYRPSTNTAASPLLFSSSGSYIFAATDLGIYYSCDQGKNWFSSVIPNEHLASALATTSRFIFARANQKIYKSDNQGAIWTEIVLESKVEEVRALVTFNDDAFVCADVGIYRSRAGAAWTLATNGLTDLNVYSITANSANGHLFAFTKNIIFLSSNQGDTWEPWTNVPIKQDLTTIVTAVKSGAGDSPLVFFGAAFTGFDGEGEAGWPNFYLPQPTPGEIFQIDLSTTNPKLLPKNWLALRLRDRDQLCQIDSIVEVQRRNFTLDSKVARIFTKTSIKEPKQFDLRDTIVLAQSEELPLMDEPLTIPEQQSKIFFDPIWDNKVRLSQYVTGLQVQHPVIVSGKRIRAELLNAGGVVQQNPQIADSQWQRWNNGLTYSNVTAFATHIKPEKGLVSIDPTVIRGFGTAFAAELKKDIELQVTVESQVTVEPNVVKAKVTAIYSDDLLSVEEFVTSGQSETAFQFQGQGTGTIASKDDIVMGSNTTFKEELKKEYLLLINGQNIKVKEIESDSKLILSAASSDLPFGTPFSYQNQGTGKIKADRTALKGSDTRFTEDLSIDQAISIGNQTYRIQRIISNELLFVDTEMSEDFDDRHFHSNTLFVGTAGGGVFRSIDNGLTWEPINQGLTTRDIQAIAVRSISLPAQSKDTQKLEGYQIFVGTAIGVFQTGFITSHNDKVEWEQINKNLACQDVRSLLIAKTSSSSDQSEILLAGTVNGGIFQFQFSDQSWNQAGLANVDVQTLIQTPNNDIFAGTITDRVFRGIRRNDRWTWDELAAGLENHPNITSLVSYEKSGQGQVTTTGKTVIGGIDVIDDVNSSRRTAFKAEFAIGDTIKIGNETRRVQQVISDLQLEVESDFLEVESNSPKNFSINFSIIRVLAGTPGGGIFRLKPDATQRPVWAPVANNPADLNVLCLAVNPADHHLFAGTASGGIFQSIDEGNLWTPLNTGLTSLDPLINPRAKVNTEFRTLGFVNQTLFATGGGILISPDNLYTIPLRSGDRLSVMAPPIPMPPKGRETIDPTLEQKWLLTDRDHAAGVVFTASPEDIRLLPAATADPTISEDHYILQPPQDQQEPLLTLREPIQNSYDPQTVKIYANVVAATHGETIQEILGNGTSALPNQTFQLKKIPLTYISATTPTGAETTLQVRINQVLWQEELSLYQQSPRDSIYITRIADDSNVTITFGDGTNGARIPTGIDNVTATYRAGIGLVGLISADRLSLLKTRPLGITQVTNPLPTTGAADPETMNEARTSAPLTVRTLDRIVSFQDYEDFARAFAGIGKAQADLLMTGETQLLHITVAAVGGREVRPGTPLYNNLIQAINAARDPVQPVQVTSFEAVMFNVDAKLLIDPRYLIDQVVAAAKTALMRQFTFENQSFAQPVTAAEVIATLQDVAGMIAVDLDALHRTDQIRSLEQLVPALPARWQPRLREILPAQLLLINPTGIRLNVEVTS
jgi:hypothetical protein